MPEPTQSPLPSSRPTAELKRYIDQIYVWMGITAVVVLTPFAIHNLLRERVGLGLAMLVITGLFTANMLAVLRQKTPPVPVFVIYLVVVAVITMSTFRFRTLYGVLWAFPAVVLFHFMAHGLRANLLNGLLAVIASWLTLEVTDAPTAARLGASLVLTIAFANIFSRALQASNRAIEEARAQAERASLAKSQFLANMSHELRTPLNAIIGYAELLHEDASAEQRGEVVKDLERILSSSRHLLHMINDILDLSRIEASRLALSFGEVQLKSFVEEVADAVRPLASKNQNTLELVLAPELGARTLRTDPLRLRQCLLNLLSNACKFTQAGRVGFSVEQGELLGAPAIQFVVEDTGIGMSEEQLGRVFLPFEQADASTTRRFGGTGLGLAITARLCELMGGAISVQSRLGQGSTFTLRLPLPPPPVEATRDADSRAQDAP